ncbi:hypothetical protein FCH28_24010 [Streptomyces piniterrae]|uniref:Secreted protein n=1 Tax=Streptomyces piniterrae TaxID=2571125 RepID=A0A4U0NK80_9ACTN|nr:hypothetical protein [Streptomyces piniterrae]TJZ50344.1 hypothetical protein FCH28_24010 [Streptomyces piniterrae]
MRLRRTLGTAVSALALVLALPASANASAGTFTYLYSNVEIGPVNMGTLVDPPSGECITLPEVADESVPPAHTPTNSTDAYATVYTDPMCEGDSFTLRPLGGHASERLKVRSVMFSDPIPTEGAS